MCFHLYVFNCNQQFKANTMTIIVSAFTFIALLDEENNLNMDSKVSEIIRKSIRDDFWKHPVRTPKKQNITQQLMRGITRSKQV